MHTLRQLCYTGAKGARYDHHDFLDLDDTLFSFQQAEQVALEETMRHYTLPYSDEILALYSAGNDAQWKLLEQGKVQRSEIATAALTCC